MRAQASPFLARLSAPALRYPVGTLASPVGPYVLAFPVAFHWPGPLTVRANSLDSFLPSPVQTAPGRRSPDAGYGAAGVSMCSQRERSLTPCWLMALTR